MIWCLKEASHCEGSFEYPQHKFGWEIKQLITWYAIITIALIHAIVNWYLPTGLYKISSG